MDREDSNVQGGESPKANNLVRRATPAATPVPRSEPVPLGKVSPDFLKRAILPKLGARRPGVVVGPAAGTDCGAVDLGAGRVLAMTTDPFFVVPPYGWDRAAWFAVHILASDFTTCGLAPEWMSVDLNLPAGTPDSDIEALWDAVHRHCEALGIAVVTGHTGRYDGCNYPMVGGATLLGTGPRSALKSPKLAQAGDALIITKGPAIEACALMAASFRDRVAGHLGEQVAHAGDALFRQMSTVAEARLALETCPEGVRAMHDATEGGVLGAVAEMAEAAGLGVDLDLDSLPWAPGVRELCAHFGMDPLAAISEGTLLIVCAPEEASAVVSALNAARIQAAQVGTLQASGQLRCSQGGQSRPLVHPRIDPFWAAFARASEAA